MLNEPNISFPHGIFQFTGKELQIQNMLKSHIIELLIKETVVASKEQKTLYILEPSMIDYGAETEIHVPTWQEFNEI